MPEKWQEALKLWDKWDQSIDHARSKILTRYGGIRRLKSRLNQEDDFLGNLLDDTG